MKKLSAILLALTMLLTAACAKKSGNSSDIKGQTAQEVSVVQPLYKESQIKIGERFSECISIQKYSGGYYFFYEDSKHELKLVKLDSDFTVSEPIALGKSLSIGWGTIVHDDGSFTILSPVTDYELEYDEYGVMKNYSSFIREGSVSFVLTDYDSSGNITAQHDVTGIDEYYNLRQSRLSTMIPYKDGGYLVPLGCGVAIISEDGTVTDGQVYEQQLADFGLDSDGKLIMSMHNGFAYMEEDSLNIPDELINSEEWMMLTSSAKSGEMGFKAFFKKDDGIYGLTDSGELLHVVDFRGSLIDSVEVHDYVFCGDGQFLAAGMERDYLTLHTRRPDDYKEDRKTVDLWQIHVGGGSGNTTAFNKQNDDYLVKMAIDLKSLEDLSQAVLTGDSPDLIFYGNRSVLDGMLNLGAAADIYPYMESYDGVKRDDIMPNVLEAFDMDGKLYAIPENFCVSSWYANSNVVGEEYRNWSFDDMYEKFESCPDNMCFADEQYNNDLFYTLLSDHLNPWVDAENGTCNFNSKDFVKLLEFCKNTKNASALDVTAGWDVEYLKRQSTVMDGEHAMISVNSSSRYGVLHAAEELARMGLPFSEASILNLPGGSGKGKITCDNCFTIMNTGDCPDGAWAFVSYLLSDEKQIPMGEEFPGWNWTNKKVFETGLQNSVTKEPQTRKVSANLENGEIFEYEYPLVITEEDVQRYKEFVMNCTELEYGNSDIHEILWDEIERYRNDEITAEECASYIQSRAEILLSEKS